MVTDRDSRRRRELPMPESVQGIVAARLDALPTTRRRCSRTRPCSGRCSGSARRRIGGVERTAAEAALHRLERKEFVRRERRPSVAGESEYAFRHLLVRDVAYGQIPRARRAEKHRLAGEWIESSAVPRTTPRCSRTITRARSSSRGPPAPTRSRSRGRRGCALQEAGDRAYALSAYPAAKRFYAAALEAGPRTSRRARLLHSLWPRPEQRRARQRPEVLLDAGVEAALASGDRARRPKPRRSLCEMYWLLGRRDERVRAAARRGGARRGRADLVLEGLRAGERSLGSGCSPVKPTTRSAAGVRR